MKKVKLESLSIEITRRCNMKCSHCLCGDAQDVDIDFAHIRNILRHISEIKALTFTGGEPSLNVPAISFTLNQIKRRKIHIEEFAIITNGSKSSISKPFINICRRLYDYQELESNPGYDDFMLYMSNDPYHDNTHQDKVHKVLSKYPFYGKRLRDGETIRLINQGRSSQGIQLGNAKIGLDRGGVFGSVFLSATGFILAECDFSYDNQEKHKLCHSSGFMKYLKSVEIKRL